MLELFACIQNFFEDPPQDTTDATSTVDLAIQLWTKMLLADSERLKRAEDSCRDIKSCCLEVLAELEEEVDALTISSALVFQPCVTD